MQENVTTEIKKLNDHLQQHPTSMLFARLADKYLNVQEIDKAIDLCQHGLRHHPNYSSAYFVLAKCFLARKQYDEAERRLKRVLSLEPSFLKAHKLYSDLMAEIGWTQSSEASLRKIHEIDPLFPVHIETTAIAVEPEPVATAPALELESVVEGYAVDKLVTDDSMYHEPAPTPSTSRVSMPPDFEDELTADLSGDDFEREEARFSEILDDLFSPRMAEEERLEIETRSSLERVADRELATKPVKPIVPEVPILPPEPPRPVEPPPYVPKMDARPPAIEPKSSFLLDELEEEPVSKPLDILKTPPPLQPPFASVDAEHKADEDPFTLDEADSVPFNNEEEDYSSFLSALDDMNTAEEGISFDSELLQPEEEPISFDHPGDPYIDEEPPADDMEAFVNAKNRTEKPKEKFVTPTLGEIYAAQGQYAKAINVFELLLKKNPDNEWYKTKLDYLKKKLQEDRS
jgi:tetratricopeptide (TPR) repeat protein